MKLAVVFPLLFAPALIAAPSPKDEALQLTGDIHVIFDKKCNECHGSHLKKPDGDFGYVLDLSRMADNRDYILRGHPGKSELYRMVNEEEMPPDDHPATPPLTAGEKETVRRWILAGAPSDLPPNLQNTASAPAITAPSAVVPRAPAAASTAPAVASNASGSSAKETAKKTAITLDVTNQPAGEIFARIAQQSGLRVDYIKPAHEPRLSINLKNGTVFEALEYLMLCGNFSLSYQSDSARIGPNP